MGLEDAHYFPLGDLTGLTDRITKFAARPWPLEARRRTREWLAQRNDWQCVAEWTLRSYRKALDPRRNALKWRAAARRGLQHAISP
jgi:hypothetical protein